MFSSTCGTFDSHMCVSISAFWSRSKIPVAMVVASWMVTAPVAMSSSFGFAFYFPTVHLFRLKYLYQFEIMALFGSTSVYFFWSHLVSGNLCLLI